MPSATSRWEGSADWYLWDGGFLVIGRSEGVVPPHAHHAFQLVVAVDGVVRIAGADGVWKEGRGVVVPADVEHSYDGNRAIGAMLFVDPDSSEGAWLRATFKREITLVPDARIETCIGELRTFVERPLEGMAIGPLIRHCALNMCAGVPPVRRLDERVTRVLGTIRDSEDLRLSLEDAAAIIHLSPSRFAHLFKQQVGLPFRRYILWRKLARAVLSVGRERTLSAAAHTAGFADAAHLTRTFYQMFGIAPSVMMRGNFHEIESPFFTL